MNKVALMAVLSTFLVACGSTTTEVSEKTINGKQFAANVEKSAAKYYDGVKCRHTASTGTRLRQTKCTTPKDREKQRRIAQQELERARQIKDWHDTNTDANF